MAYRVTKTYGHNLGLSACFRQWRAKSHCRFLHGYALEFKFTFEADTLDENNWVIDFGSLKPLKEWLVATFDHRLLVAEDDPQRTILQALTAEGQITIDGVVHKHSTPESRKHQLADVLVVKAVGCEAFARLAWGEAARLVWEMEGRPTKRTRVRLIEVEVREHGANSAIYLGENR